MARYTLTYTRLKEGTWEGLLQMEGGTKEPPRIGVTHLGSPLDGVRLNETSAPGEWQLEVPVPASAIADGVQTFVISDLDDDRVVDSFSLICGDAAEQDLLAEVALLRAELDLLKRAFRRHCLETK